MKSKKNTKRKKRKNRKKQPSSYKTLIKQKQKRKISKKNSKRLDRILNKKYCKCIKSLKSNKKLQKGIEYPICINSIYKNRGFSTPYRVIQSCKK